MPILIVLFLLVLLPLFSGGCATATWPATVYNNPNLSLRNYSTFSFTLPVTANVVEDKTRGKIIKLLENNGYKYVENKETADFLVEEKSLWEEKTSYTAPRVEYTPLYAGATVIYIPTYVPERPYTYYEFNASLTFYDRVSKEKIYEGNIEGTTSYPDPEGIYQDLIKQSNIPLSAGQVRALTKKFSTKESYKVYTTRQSKIYHRAGCPELGAEEILEFNSEEEAKNAGGKACQRCRP